MPHRYAQVRPTFCTLADFSPTRSLTTSVLSLLCPLACARDSQRPLCTRAHRVARAPATARLNVPQRHSCGALLTCRTLTGQVKSEQAMPKQAKSVRVSIVAFFGALSICELLAA